MILLNNNRLDRIRSLKGTPYYDRCLASAEIGIAATGSPDTWWWRLPHMALIALMEVRPELAQEAAARMFRVLDDDALMKAWQNWDQGYLYRMFEALALTYDWAGGYLTPVQNARCRQVFLDMAWRPWKEKFWGHDSYHSNYFGGYLLTVTTQKAGMVSERSRPRSDLRRLPILSSRTRWTRILVSRRSGISAIL
jgi:hypothetical protein